MASLMIWSAPLSFLSPHRRPISLWEFCVNRYCFVVLRCASWCYWQRAPRGKLWRLLRLFYKISTHNAEVEGSSPSLTTSQINGMGSVPGTSVTFYTEDGKHFSPERILGASDRAQLLIEEAQVVFHKADQPDSVADLFDADVLASEHGAEVDLLLPDADPAAVGDRDGAIVEVILKFSDAPIGARRARIKLCRIVHADRLVRRSEERRVG